MPWKQDSLVCTIQSKETLQDFRPLFTGELGYRVALSRYGKTWENIENHGVLPVPVRRNRGILRSLLLILTAERNEAYWLM